MNTTSQIDLVYQKEMYPEACSLREQGYLCLIKAPTGMGKTHSASKTLFEYVKQNKGKHCIYVTTLVSNVKDCKDDAQAMEGAKKGESKIHQK